MNVNSAGLFSKVIIHGYKWYLQVVHPTFYDRNKDAMIDMREMRHNLENIFDIYLQPHDVNEMLVIELKWNAKKFYILV